jgi:hypothetical protein
MKAENNKNKDGEIGPGAVRPSAPGDAKAQPEPAVLCVTGEMLNAQFY